MTRRLRQLGQIIVALALLAALPGPAAAETLRVDGIRRGGTAAETRLVVETSDKAPYRAFLLGGPNRLVVDIPAAQWRAQRSSYFDGGLVKGYRSGELDGGLTRIVFDLAKPATVKAAFTLPAAKDKPPRIVIDLSASSQNLFNAALDKVHGDANLRQSATAAAAPSSAYRAEANRQLIASTTTTTTTTTTTQMVPVRKPPGMRAGAAAGQPPQAPAVPASARRVVIVDAGHGGHDPGAISSNVREKNLTLAMAKALKTELENTGRYKVYLTRDTDIFIPLRQRVAIARAKGGELFLSLHADKVSRSNVRGASIYTLSETASDAETERLAEQENKAGTVAGVDLSGEEADVADILLDLAMREKMNESNLLARFIEEALRRKNIRLLPNSHRSAGFAVLKAPDVPSALIEIGFLSNPDEAKLLNSNDFQKKMAAALREGVDAYFTKILALQKI